MTGTVVVVFAEGPSDELFLKRVVAPALQGRQIWLKPQTLETSPGHTGGAINFDRVKRHARNALRQYPGSCLATFFDLYALDSEMPGNAAAAALSAPALKAMHIEAELGRALAEQLGCRADRLLPHVQPYELEGLFFSAPEQLATAQPGWEKHAAALRLVRDAHETPEHINDSFDTKPSARLGRLLVPRYRKTRHAPLIGMQVGPPSMLAECPHFAGWVRRLESLVPP